MNAFKNDFIETIKKDLAADIRNADWHRGQWQEYETKVLNRKILISELEDEQIANQPEYAEVS